MKPTAKAVQPLKTAAPKGVPGSNNIMSELWERAAPSLDEEALKWFAGATEQAESLTENLQCALAGIAEAGSFQGDDVPALLYTIAHAIDNICGISHVGREAGHRLNRPEFYR